MSATSTRPYSAAITARSRPGRSPGSRAPREPPPRVSDRGAVRRTRSLAPSPTGRCIEDHQLHTARHPRGRSRAPTRTPRGAPRSGRGSCSSIVTGAAAWSSRWKRVTAAKKPGPEPRRPRAGLHSPRHRRGPTPPADVTASIAVTLMQAGPWIPRVPSVAALEQIAADGDAGAVTDREEQVVLPQRRVQRGALHARLGAGRPRHRVEAEVIQGREVEQEPAVAQVGAHPAVTARADAELHALRAGELDGSHDVLLAVGLDHEVRVAIRGARVPDGARPRLLVAGVPRRGPPRRSPPSSARRSRQVRSADAARAPGWPGSRTPPRSAGRALSAGPRAWPPV